MVLNKGDKIVFYIFFICSVITLLLITISLISGNRLVYFFGGLLFLIVLPAFIIFSLSLKFLYGNIPKQMTYIIRIFAIFVYVCFIFACRSDLSSTFLDIPNVVNGNYAYISGKPYDISIEGIKIQTQYFTINKKKFSIENHMLGMNLDRSKNYRITYLRNSNYVIDITEE